MLRTWLKNIFYWEIRNEPIGNSTQIKMFGQKVLKIYIFSPFLCKSTALMNNLKRLKC